MEAYNTLDQSNPSNLSHIWIRVWFVSECIVTAQPLLVLSNNCPTFWPYNGHFTIHLAYLGEKIPENALIYLVFLMNFCFLRPAYTLQISGTNRFLIDLSIDAGLRGLH